MVDDAKAGGATSGANAAANGATEAGLRRDARREADCRRRGHWLLGPENRACRARYGVQYVLVCAVLAQEIACCCGAGKKIRLIIAVGHGKTQGFSRKTKSVEALSSVECAKAPAWFAAAMEAAQLAPTAMNKPEFQDHAAFRRETVRIDAPQNGLNVIDEGIVRCDFEIAANEAGADWRWERDI